MNPIINITVHADGSVTADDGRQSSAMGGASDAAPAPTLSPQAQANDHAQNAVAPGPEDTVSHQLSGSVSPPPPLELAQTALHSSTALAPAPGFLPESGATQAHGSAPPPEAVPAGLSALGAQPLPPGPQSGSSNAQANSTSGNLSPPGPTL